MKKQTKSHFLQMANLLPELDVEKQRRILGGTAVAITPPEDVNMIPVTTVAPCLTVESIPMTTTMAPESTLTSPVETSSMPVSTVGTPLETMFASEMVTSSVPVLSCVTVECVPTITTMVPEPTLTSPVETSSMPVSTVGTPLETMSTPEMVTPPSATTPPPISSTEIVSATTSSWWDDAATWVMGVVGWLYEHSTVELGVRGEVTYGANFAGILENGMGLEISPKYGVLLETDLNTKDGLTFDGMDKEGRQFAIYYGMGGSYNQTKEGDRTTNTFSVGWCGLNISYSYDNQGNEGIYVGGNVSGKIALYLGVEGEMKAGFNIDW